MGGGGFGSTPSHVATPLGGKGWEGRGADSVSCPRAHKTLATPLGLFERGYGHMAIDLAETEYRIVRG